MESISCAFLSLATCISPHTWRFWWCHSCYSWSFQQHWKVNSTLCLFYLVLADNVCFLWIFYCKIIGSRGGFDMKKYFMKKELCLATLMMSLLSKNRCHHAKDISSKYSNYHFNNFFNVWQKLILEHLPTNYHIEFPPPWFMIFLREQMRI